MNRAGICTPIDKNFQELIEMSNFSKEIPNENSKSARCLTKGTRNCLSQTCNGLVNLSIHLLFTTHECVLLGNFTSDSLRKQLRKLRQWSRRTYFITVQQILEKVSIYKAKLLSKLDEELKFLENIESRHSCQKYRSLLNEDICNVFENLPELEYSLQEDTKVVLICIAGYIFHKDERLMTQFFIMKNMIKIIDLGGLNIPVDMVCQWTFYSYFLFHEVVNDTYRTPLFNLVMMILEYDNLNIDRNHGSAVANIILKNHSYLYFVHFERELKSKILKPGAD